MTYLPSFRLDGKKAIVTGASRGLGRHVALALAEAGADLALIARRVQELKPVARAAKDLGRHAVTIAADLAGRGTSRGRHGCGAPQWH